MNKVLSKESKTREGFPALDRQASFEHLNERLLKAISIKTQVEYVVQMYFSWIALNDLWQEPVVWVDPHDPGVVYESEKDIPDSLRQAVSVRPKYNTQEDWIRDLERTSPRFSRSTAYMRHRYIRQLMDLGRPFESALKSVILSPGLTKTIRHSVMEDGSLDVAAIEKLTKSSGRAKELDDPREKLLAYMEDKEEDLETGVTTPRQVCQDIRTKVFGDHTLVPSWSESSAGDIKIFHERPDGTIAEYYLLACDERGQPTSLPSVVRDWLDRRMKLTDS